MAKPKVKNPLIEDSTSTEDSDSISQAAAPVENTVAPKAAALAKDLGITEKLDRVYKGANTIHHDLYKLEVAMFKKNLAVMGSDQLLLDDVEHCHYFHSVNSDGKPQTHCSQIAGHFHVMEIVPRKDGPPAVRCASGPVQFGRKSYIDAKGKKKFKTVVIPLNDYDKHTHQVTYKASSEVKQRVANMEATMVDSHWQTFGAPPKGVL